MAAEDGGPGGGTESSQCEEGTGLFITVAAGILLFLLITGLAGSVDVKTLRAQLHRRRGIGVALLCQFFMMPFIGFIVVKLAKPLPHVGLMILILCSSSGGAYSNWWCSLFNADLALSIAMTAVSTLMSGVMLPLNLTVYLSFIGEKDSIDIPWGPLLQSLGTVFLAILVGIGISTKCPHCTKVMNALGNLSGICLIAITTGASMLKKKPDAGGENITPLWGHEAKFYLVVAAPFFVCLFLSLANSSLRCLQLSRPERVAIVVEVSYQNIGIASAVAVAAFCGNAKLRADAAAVPVVYGLIQSTCLGLFCIIMWKCNWTYAPREVSICTAVKGDYQPRLSKEPDLEAFGSAKVLDKDCETNSTQTPSTPRLPTVSNTCVAPASSAGPPSSVFGARAVGMDRME